MHVRMSCWWVSALKFLTPPSNLISPSANHCVMCSWYTKHRHVCIVQPPLSKAERTNGYYPELRICFALLSEVMYSTTKMIMAMQDGDKHVIPNIHSLRIDALVQIVSLQLCTSTFWPEGGLSQAIPKLCQMLLHATFGTISLSSNLEHYSFFCSWCFYTIFLCFAIIPAK